MVHASANAELTRDVAVIGAGPAGLFALVELGLLGLSSVVLEARDCAGGQVSALYPKTTLHDVPAWPAITGDSLIERLLHQAAPFAPLWRSDSRVERLRDNGDGRLQVTTDRGDHYRVAAVLIATGVGGFVPRRLALPGAQALDDHAVFHVAVEASQLTGHDVVVLGDGDAALRAALDALDNAASVTLVHDRAALRAEPATVQVVQLALEARRLRFFAGDVVALHRHQGALVALSLRGDAGDVRRLPATRLLVHQGLAIEAAPLSAWGVEVDEDGGSVRVDASTMASSRPGVFALGDVAAYPGKLKHLRSGFHEAALAARAAFAHIRPDALRAHAYGARRVEPHHDLKVANAAMSCGVARLKGQDDASFSDFS